MTRLAITLVVTLALAATASAQAPLGLRYGGGLAKMSPEVAVRKAVAAMVAEKLPFAEVTADGHVRGWNESAAVFVLCLPQPDPEQSLVLVVTSGGTTEAEDERLRVAVLKRIHEAKDDPATPKRVAPADGKVPPAPVSIVVKTEDRTATPVLKHFAPVASLVMEKMGLETKPDGPVQVMGRGPSAMVITLMAPAANALNAKFGVVTVAKGDKPAEKLAADILERVVKVLYE